MIRNKDVRDILLALNMLPKEKTTDTKFYYDYIQTFKYSPKNKTVFTTHAIVKFHKGKLANENGDNKVTTFIDERYSFRTIVEVYKYLGSEYQSASK